MQRGGLRALDFHRRDRRQGLGRSLGIVRLQRRRRPCASIHLRLHRSAKGVTKAAVAGALPHVSLHGLRHTFASIAIAEGMRVTQVAKLLGHKDPEITLKRYSHWFRAASSRNAMQTIAGAILRGNGRSAVGQGNSGA